MLTIRPVDKTDLKTLADIYLNSYNPLDIGEHWNKESAYQLMKFFYQWQPDLFFLAEYEGKIAGAAVALVKPWWDGNHLTDGEIFVLPKFQKKGIGTKLLLRLFEVAMQKYNALSWDTFTHIIYDHPLSWYKKLGFSQIKHWTMISGDVKEILAKNSSEI